MRYVCDAIVTPRGRKERERSAKSKNEMIIGYGRTIFPHEIKKQISQPTIFPYKNNGKRLTSHLLLLLLLLFVFFWEERTLAPAANALVFACVAKADIF